MLLDSIIRALPIIDATMLPMYTVQGRRNESNFGKPFIREPRLIVVSKIYEGPVAQRSMGYNAIPATVIRVITARGYHFHRLSRI